MNGTENCDTQDFGGITCQSYGFDDGTLACGTDCATVDRAGCSGTETCGDGRDNDGDGRRDCFDSDCLTACSDSCAGATPLSDPATVTGDTASRPKQVEPTCLGGQSSGSEQVYRFTAASTGVLDARLTSGGVGNFSLSARSDCTSTATELACSERDASNGATESVRLEVTQGQVVYLVVDGTGFTTTGTFSLEARTRPTVCGDLITDPSEQCDDGVDPAGGVPVGDDGCAADCYAEISELESNATTALANTYTAGWVGRLQPVGDVDVMRITTTAGRYIELTVGGFGNVCSDNELDTVVELLDSTGAVLGSDDDGGSGYCSFLRSGPHAAGTYYVRVTGGVLADSPVTYTLRVAEAS